MTEIPETYIGRIRVTHPVLGPPVEVNVVTSSEIKSLISYRDDMHHEYTHGARGLVKLACRNKQCKAKIGFLRFLFSFKPEDVIIHVKDGCEWVKVPRGGSKRFVIQTYPATTFEGELQFISPPIVVLTIPVHTPCDDEIAHGCGVTG